MLMAEPRDPHRTARRDDVRLVRMESEGHLVSGLREAQLETDPLRRDLTAAEATPRDHALERLARVGTLQQHAKRPPRQVTIERHEMHATDRIILAVAAPVAPAIDRARGLGAAPANNATRTQVESTGYGLTGVSST